MKLIPYSAALALISVPGRRERMNTWREECSPAAFNAEAPAIDCAGVSPGRPRIRSSTGSTPASLRCNAPSIANRGSPLRPMLPESSPVNDWIPISTAVKPALLILRAISPSMSSPLISPKQASPSEDMPSSRGRRSSLPLNVGSRKTISAAPCFFSSPSSISASS